MIGEGVDDEGFQCHGVWHREPFGDGVANGEGFVPVVAVVKGFPLLPTQRTFHNLVQWVPSTKTPIFLSFKISKKGTSFG